MPQVAGFPTLKFVKADGEVLDYDVRPPHQNVELHAAPVYHVFPGISCPLHWACGMVGSAAAMHVCRHRCWRLLKALAADGAGGDGAVVAARRRATAARRRC